VAQAWREISLAPLEDGQRVNVHRLAAGLDPLGDDEIATALADYPP
jgi:hypothetical protein